MKYFLLLFLMSCSQKSSVAVGLVHGVLADCSGVAICWQSQNEQLEKFIAPISSEEESDRIRQKVESITVKLGGKLVSQQDQYSHYEFENMLTGGDDLEFFFEGQNVFFRSASRGGFTDMGKNKERIEALRFRFFQNDF